MQNYDIALNSMRRAFTVERLTYIKLIGIGIAFLILYPYTGETKLSPKYFKFLRQRIKAGS
jgi:hypothetical protein